MQKIRLVAVDDHHLIREGMETCFARQNDMELVAIGEAGEDILPLINEHRPDVILLDYKLPSTKKDDRKDFRLIPVLEKIHRDNPDLQIMVVSAFHDGALIKRCLDAGANGFFSKRDTQHGFAEAIRAIMRNGQFLSETAAQKYANAPLSILTRRQTEVLQLIDTYAHITDYGVLAQMLNISESTFKKHLTQAMRRLGTSNNRLAAIKRAKELNLIE